MEGIMKPYSHHETPVEAAFEHLPQDLQKVHPPEVLASLQNKDYHLPVALLFQIPVPEGRLDEGYNLPPFFCPGYTPASLPGTTLGGVFPSCLMPPPEQFSQIWRTNHSTYTSSG